MAADRLDAIVIGAGVEGLAAAIALARSGLWVIVVERKLSPRASRPRASRRSSRRNRARSRPHRARRAVCADGADRRSRGRRQRVVIWPEPHAARAPALRRLSAAGRRSLCRVSQPDRARGALAGAHELARCLAHERRRGLRKRMLRRFWLSSIAHALDEAFDSDLLKGIWAHGAVMGTGVSPVAPMSASLFTRASLLSDIAPELAGRSVSGGRSRLIASLISQFVAFGGELRMGAEAVEVIIDRDAAQGVELVGGVMLRAPLVLSSLDPRRELSHAGRLAAAAAAGRATDDGRARGGETRSRTPDARRSAAVRQNLGRRARRRAADPDKPERRAAQPRPRRVPAARCSATKSR